MTTPVTARYYIITHAVGAILRGERLNIGVLIWGVQTGDYRIAIDPRAVVRAQSVDLADRRRWADYYRDGSTPAQYAERTRAFLIERIETFAAGMGQPVSDATITAWIRFPTTASFYSEVHFGGAGEYYIEDIDLDQELARLMHEYVLLPDPAGE